MKTTLVYMHTSVKEDIDFKPELGAVIENSELKDKNLTGFFIVSGFLYSKIENVYECDVFCSPVQGEDIEEERKKILKDSGY